MPGRSRKRIDLAKVEEKDDLIITNIGINNKSVNNCAKSNKIKFIAIFVFVLLLVSTFLFAVKFINFGVVEMIWKTSVTKGSDSINNKSIKYESFQNGLMRISNDGITYIIENGDVKWAISYNMKDPIYMQKDKYFAVADRNGFDLYLFDETGVKYNKKTTYPIERISLTVYGNVFVAQSDEENSYINLFDHNGTALDFEVTSNLSNNGTIIDFSSSSDGNEIVVSYAYISNDRICTKATYYSLKNDSNNHSTKNIIGEFLEELYDKYIARSYYFNENNSCLIFDGGIYFVTTFESSTPIIIKEHVFDSKIRSVSYNNKFLSIVFEDSKLVVFDNKGNIISEKKLDFDYENFYISEDYIIFLYNNRVMIYDERCRMIFDKEMEMDIQFVAKKKSILFTELLIGLIDGVECVRFY